MIKEKSETIGVTAEYKWLREHYPNSKVEKQSLRYNNKKPYDVMSVKLESGETKDIYFDISNFFGKF